MLVTAIKHLISLYRTIPHTLQKFRIKELTQRCFSKRNGEQMYQYFVIGRNKSCFVQSYSKFNNTYKQDEIIQMLDFLVDNIFVKYHGLVFQQAMGISMGANCEPLLADLFLHVHEAIFRQGLLKNDDKKFAQIFNSIICYIDDVPSLNNIRFGDYLHRIYPNELEVHDTIDTQKYVSYIDLHLKIDSQ
jgi:hypothetical protein